MGGLHIEQNLLKMYCQLLHEPGMDDIINKAGLKTIGLKVAACDVNDIKKARYILQVLASCLYKNLLHAYEQSGSTLLLLDWASAQSTEDEMMFYYWYEILQFQINILLVVHSFREANLELLISTLMKCVELCFSLDHVHYARWLSVFLQDLQLLKVEDEELYENLRNHMSVTSTKGKFSKIAYDQIHEQNNKKIKATSGTINLVNKENRFYMRKLEICNTEILHFLEQYMSLETKAHHTKKKV